MCFKIRRDSIFSVCAWTQQEWTADGCNTCSRCYYLCSSPIILQMIFAYMLKSWIHTEHFKVGLKGVWSKAGWQDKDGNCNWSDIHSLSLVFQHSKETTFFTECICTWIFLQFLLIFRRAAAGELQEESGLMALARLSEINVSTEGVMGAKDFFEAKVLYVWHLPSEWQYLFCSFFRSMLNITTCIYTYFIVLVNHFLTHQIISRHNGTNQQW